MNPPLYNRDLLALAVATARYPRLTDATVTKTRRAPLCGSRIELDLVTAPDGRIAALGMHSEACAVGQAAAAVFAGGAVGRSAAELAATLAAIDAWLAGADAAPDWPGFAPLLPVRDFPARHGALRLPFAAAVDALTGAAGEEAA